MSTDQGARLRTVLGDLMDNRVSLADAAAQVRAMHFPEPPDKTVSQQMAESYEQEAPPTEKPGSFRMVSRAYAVGRINLRQYEALAEAAAESIKADTEAKGEQRGAA